MPGAVDPDHQSERSAPTRLDSRDRVLDVLGENSRRLFPGTFADLIEEGI